MLIIVEGPNGAGKSTLVGELQKYLENNYPGDTVELMHKGPPASHPLDEYVLPLVNYRPGQGHHVICDRWHWGEKVYPDVFHRATQLDRGVWTWVEMFLRSRGAVVVYPYVSAATLTQRITERGDDLIDASMILREWAAFNSVRFQSALPVRMFSQLESAASETQLSSIIELGHDHEVRAAVLNDLQTYVGPPRPDFLLVGDTRSRRGLKSPITGAFGPRPATSGHFLLNALSGPRVVNIGLINANDVDDIGDAYVTLGQPPVVSLGHKASRALSLDGWGVGMDIKHSKVPHPQYIRRFHSKRAAEYGAIIDSAMCTRKDLSKWRP